MSKPLGRPSDYTIWKARAICMRLANGESLRTITKRKGYPSRFAVNRWLAKYEDFRIQYALAREQQAEYYLDEIMELCDYGSNRATAEDSNVMVQRDKLGIDTRKWVMERMSAKKYGSKQSIDMTADVKADVKVETNLTTEQKKLLDKVLDDEY